MAAVPVFYGGELRGGVVLASRGAGDGVFGFFLQSSFEAAMLASALGGGLVLLLASLLGRRVERLAAGARAIARGDLSHRIEPGFGDELGQLARAFNSMAERLQASFSGLEERVAERTAELEAERARLEAVLRQMPSGVVIAEAPSGRVVLSNEQAQRIRGRPLPPRLGDWERDDYGAFFPDGSPYEPEDLPLARTVRTGEEVKDEEMVLARGDGEERAAVLVNSSPVRDQDGRIVGGVAVFYDVTERRRAEEEIRRLNEGLERRIEERTALLERGRRTLKVVLDNLSEGVMALDAEGRVVFANPAAHTMLGESGGEGMPEGVPDPWEDFDLPLAVARVSEGGEGVVARVGGSRTPLLEVRLRPLPPKDDGDAAGGVLVVAQDLSEGRRLEERQQRFLSDAAHELKTPLTAILGAAELLEEDDEDPEIRRRFLGHIRSEARRMVRLSETLLRLARTGADLREPHLRPVEMGFLKEVAERAEPLVERAGLELVVEDRGGLVRADPEWLEQALLILVSNAAKHSGKGKRVWLRVRGGTFEVEDEGEGIREEDLPHVFERNYRGEGASSGGFGLGLPICRELVERMGGTISVESEEGAGTIARIRLPEVEPDG